MIPKNLMNFERMSNMNSYGFRRIRIHADRFEMFRNSIISTTVKFFFRFFFYWGGWCLQDCNIGRIEFKRWVVFAVAISFISNGHYRWPVTSGTRQRENPYQLGDSVTYIGSTAHTRYAQAYSLWYRIDQSEIPVRLFRFHSPWCADRRLVQGFRLEVDAAVSAPEWSHAAGINANGKALVEEAYRVAHENAILQFPRGFFH